MIGNSDSFCSRPDDQVLPRLPDVYELMNEQCALLADVMQVLVQYLADGDCHSTGKLRLIWQRGDAIKECYLNMFD